MKIILSSKAQEVFNSPKVRFYAKLRKRRGGTIMTIRPLFSNTKTEDQANIVDGTIEVPNSFIHNNDLQFTQSAYVLTPTSSGQYALIGVDNDQEISPDALMVQIYL